MDFLTSLFGDGFDAASKVVGALTIFIGLPIGLWKAWMSRPLAARAETKITGTLQWSGANLLLVTGVTVKNVGLSRIDLAPNATKVRVLVCCDEKLDEPSYEPEWHRVISYLILEDHNRVESSEIIEDQKVVTLTPEMALFADVVAVRIELRTSGKGRTWITHTVVPMPVAVPPPASPVPGA